MFLRDRFRFRLMTTFAALGACGAVLSMAACNALFGVERLVEPPPPDISGDWTYQITARVTYALAPDAGAREGWLPAAAIGHRRVVDDFFLFGRRERLWAIPFPLTDVSADVSRYAMPTLTQGAAYLAAFGLEAKPRTQSLAVLVAGDDGQVRLRVATRDSDAMGFELGSAVESSIMPSILPMANGDVFLWLAKTAQFETFAGDSTLTLERACPLRLLDAVDDTLSPSEIEDYFVCTSTGDSIDKVATAIRCQCARRLGDRFHVDTDGGFKLRGTGGPLHASDGLVSYPGFLRVRKEVDDQNSVAVYDDHAVSLFSARECIGNYLAHLSTSTRNAVTCMPVSVRSGYLSPTVGPVGVINGVQFASSPRAVRPSVDVFGGEELVRIDLAAADGSGAAVLRAIKSPARFVALTTVGTGTAFWGETDPRGTIFYVGLFSGDLARRPVSKSLVLSDTDGGDLMRQVEPSTLLSAVRLRTETPLVDPSFVNHADFLLITETEIFATARANSNAMPLLPRDASSD